MFRKVLVANRGEIARRVIRSLRGMGVASVAVWSDADRFAPHVTEADEAVRLGPAPASESYLNIDAVLRACRDTGADAVHPGYGFLSENAAFAEALARDGISFIGPRPEHLRDFGLKHTARALAQAAGVPLLPGTGLLDTLDHAHAQADDLGYPLMLKSTAGGGGIGMQLCHDPDSLRTAFGSVLRNAQASFGDARVYLERFVQDARHIEVQVFGDGAGRVVTLGERDCSLQRRNQKVIEETPAPGLSDAQRTALHRAAHDLCASVNYLSAGTVEFIFDPSRGEMYFLEVNTRLQVEHPVTEAVFGIDLVAWMIRQAAGETVIPASPLTPKGAAMEARLYAEAPHAGFRPSAGRLTEVQFPATARIDGWIATGTEVTAFYDPMLAKIITHGADRAQALARLQDALARTRISGIATNLDYLRTIAADADFAAGRVSTAALARLPFTPPALEVLAPGPQSTLQDLPGRRGLWHVGVPPSGPMDPRSHANANRLLGNPDAAATLEMTLSGPSLRALGPLRLAIAGADMALDVDGAAVTGPVIDLTPGAVLTIGAIRGPGQRAYLAIAGGFDAPETLGARAAFALGQFGGHATGALRMGDLLRASTPPETAPRPAPQTAPRTPEPVTLTHDWQIAVVYGPHGAPDFFTDDDIATLFSHAYEVHFNSARTGVRLIGPSPQWARTDGGEAGLHPSNIHDTAYVVGAIDFTGDMPILLGPDGPSLGGFVCPAVVTQDDLWKLGQLRPGDRVRFTPAARPRDPAHGPQHLCAGAPILAVRADTTPGVSYRRQGDASLLVEYGPMMLDIGLRLRVHLLMQAVADAGLPVTELTPGIRSLQVQFDPTRITRADLLRELSRIEDALPDASAVSVPSRTVHLPLSWNDPEILRAMQKYQDLVRPDAPWCPSNIDFIRRINGLPDEDAVRQTVFDANYLVMGLGDVYLGAPVATPVDPRHRLVTTKYNPARTWTPENAVGIGGAYMCIYGMEGPGGYQLFGRTLQVWNTWARTGPFQDAPWLLRFFDRIRFYPVDAQQLREARAAFPHGAFPIRIEHGTFCWAEEQARQTDAAPEIARFQDQQQTAFARERADWKARGLDSYTPPDATPQDQSAIPAGCLGIESPVAGSLWKFLAAPGARVQAGQKIAIIESMKMEISVTAPATGTLREHRSTPGATLRPGDILALLETPT
ncbi:MAG: 5-oxoprolinase/urea amidolyase family protein [Roseinatronobacter sp.]